MKYMLFPYKTFKTQHSSFSIFPATTHYCQLLLPHWIKCMEILSAAAGKNAAVIITNQEVVGGPRP